MWRLPIGIALTLLPRRWRAAFPLEDAAYGPIAAILSGILEFVLALVGLVHWYSHSVTSWAADALDSALRNGPQNEYDPRLLGLSAYVIWWIHPLTWLLASFLMEGLARIAAAVSTEQILPSWPLAVADWVYGKVTKRPPEGDAIHLPSGKEQLRSIVAATKQAVKIARLPNRPDELRESTEGADSILEIHSCRPKPDWTPPRVVCITADYYRLESAFGGDDSRPFVFRPRRLPAGVPGRTVLVYKPPHLPKANST